VLRQGDVFRDGCFGGLDADGRLLFATPQGVEVVSAGEWLAAR
jgi:hypothetical protein